jgi:transposase-like protein
MVVSICQHNSRKKHGRDRNGNQRFRCRICQKTFIERGTRPLGDMRIGLKQAANALALLLEGMSVRAAARLTGLKANTICDLVLIVGENGQRMIGRVMRGIEAKSIECDEVWSFVG